METPTSERLREAADRIDLAMREGELPTLRERVAENLGSLERLDELSDEPSAAPDRTWERVEASDAYAHNEVITDCRVPPTSEHGPLTSLDVGVKDNIEVAGVPMTAASDLLEGFVPRRDAPVVDRILAAGGRVVAKTNLDELGNAGLGANGLGGPITNPADETRTAGGSSGGSAVAVATGAVDAALGTDTGGSVRIPAAYCGVVGMKPSYGLVPRTGVVENTYCQDHVGPLAGDVETTARLLEAVAGKHLSDPTSLQAAGRTCSEVGGYVSAVSDPPAPSDLTVGVLVEGLAGPCSEAVVAATRRSIDRLADAGASVCSVSIADYEYGVPIKSGFSYVANALTYRDRWVPYRRGGGVRTSGDYRMELARRDAEAGRSLNEDFKAKVLTGALLLADDATRALSLAHAGRVAFRREFDRVLSTVDVLITPTMPDVAPPVESTQSGDYGWNVRHANIVGFPALTLPNGTVNDLPIGLQILGALDDDATVLGAARAFETLQP